MVLPSNQQPAARPRFAGPGGGSFFPSRRGLYAARVRPPARTAHAHALAVVRASRHRMPSPELLGAFVAAIRQDGALTLLQLARRYGCWKRTVARWSHRGGPGSRAIAAAVVVHAHQIATGDPTMRTVPMHILRALRVRRSDCARAVARDVAASYGVTPADLRSASRHAPLPEARQAVIVKAAKLGASPCEIAKALKRSHGYVSRVIGGAR